MARNRSIIRVLVLASLSMATIYQLGADDAEKLDEKSETSEMSTFAYLDAYDHWSSVSPEVPEGDGWRELAIMDSEGNRIIEIVNPDAEAFGSLQTKLNQLGLQEGVVPPGVRVSSRSEDGGETITIASTFARASTWFGPNSFLETNSGTGGLQGTPRRKESTMIWRETTEVMGITMTVERFRQQDAYLVRDDWGGQRIERYNESGLTSLEDQEGRVVWITRDLQGRLCEVILGDSTMLRYRYDGEGSTWSRKELVDLRNNRVLHRWDWGSFPGVPRPRMQVKLPGHGLVAEWDPVVRPVGTAVAGLGGRPYALIPFAGPQDPVRSITLADPSAELSWDRIDYTDTTITLHVVLDPAGLTNTTERSEVVIDLGRRPPPEETLEHIEGVPGEDCCPYCCSGGGGGGGGGSTGMPLPPAQIQQLNQAKSRAKSNLNNIPACAALFDGLTQTNGVEVINTSSYRAANPGATLCNGNDAYTYVGSSTVYICQGFSTLSQNGRAVRVIHEALHSAGMRERPQHPEAERTSAEINAWVKSTCNL